MKKIIALLLVAVSIFSLAACKKEPNTDPVENANEFASNQAALEAEYSKQAAEKAEKESEIQQEIDEYVEKVGKTKKKTQLVVEVERPSGREFHKYEFSRKGEYKTQIKYMFLPDLENYFAVLEAEQNKKEVKVIDKDKDMRMVAVRNDRFNGVSFDEMYELYKSEDVKNLGYTVIE